MSFHPPTPEQFAGYLDHHPLRAASPWLNRAPLLVMAGLLVLMLVMGGLAGLILPWLGLAGLLGYMAWRNRRARELERRAGSVQELAMLRSYPQAMRDAWTLLPRVATQPPLYVQTVVMLSHCLDRVKAHDAAIVGYDRLLPHFPHDHPGGIHLRIQRAFATLFADRLADADDTLRRVRGVIEPYARSSLGAAYRLAQLFQHVRTHHFADAVDEAGDLLEALRPLGIEAGYGHALLALCYHQAPPESEEQGWARHQAAKLWWGRARTLMPEAALVGRFPELNPLAKELATDEHR